MDEGCPYERPEESAGTPGSLPHQLPVPVQSSHISAPGRVAPVTTATQPPGKLGKARVLSAFPSAQKNPSAFEGHCGRRCVSQTGLPAKRSGLILSCFSFLNPCRIPAWARQNETFCLSHTLSLPQSQTHTMLGSSPSCTRPYGQTKFKVQSTLPETVTEVKKAEQE